MLLLALLCAPPAQALTVDIEFFGSIDIASYRTYAWVEGVPAPSHSVEQQIRASVDKALQAKGLRKVEGGDRPGEADCYVVTKALRDRTFQIGLLWVEVYDGESKRLAWRGKGADVATNDLKKILKTVKKVVKKMFKGFPAAAR